MFYDYGNKQPIDVYSIRPAATVHSSLYIQNYQRDDSREIVTCHKSTYLATMVDPACDIDAPFPPLPFVEDPYIC